ncbi:MAG: tripartite tricarboxylate transporter substrate binding protein [Limnohabitans sp.]|jgi:tripartite-type tricarboxylate transporter receptor subunit TctC|nr:tripartite tricarboxylate transporter substrate binding protein [Limnohabitans sp.]
MQRRTLLASAVLTPLGLGNAHAQTPAYPAKPIKLLNSSPPGSTFDTIARAACVEAEKRLGQPIITDYRSGAGGTPAFVAAKRAAPDGYTLVVLSLSTIRQPIQQDVGYESVQDFTWIASLAEINFGVIVPADSPFKSWKDLLAFAKADPKKVTYGCPSGLGNSAHIFGSEIGAREGLDWLPVPFRASNDCMTALLGGQLTFAIDTLISAAPQVKAGKVRALALATSQRSRLWPDVPTIKELGYDITIESPVGIGGPADMPAPVVQALQEAFRFAAERPAFIQLLENGALRPWFMPATEFQSFALRAEREQRALMTKYGFAKKPG